MFTPFMQLLSFFKNSITLKLQAATGRPQNSEQDLGKKFPFSCDHINKKGIRSKIKKKQKQEQRVGQGKGSGRT